MMIYYSRSEDDLQHLYRYDTEKEEFMWMDHCWTGMGEWVRYDGSYPPPFDIVEISEERAREISKDTL